MTKPLRMGVLTSIGATLDAFFPPLMDHWRDEGIEVHAAAGSAAAIPDSLVLPGLTRRPGLRSPVGARAVGRWARHQRLDVVLASTATASAIARLAPSHVPVVYFCHGLHWADASSRMDLGWQVVETVLLSRTASVIVLNAHDESWFRRRLPASKVLRLHTGVGVPLSSFPAAHLPATERLALLWVGEFTARKRPFDALEVVRELRRAGISPHLEMLGEGPLLPAVREAIATTGLTDVVTATGRGEVATALARSHLLLHTAAWEGLPRVALEAAAVGRWTYGYDVKGVVDGPASRVVPYGDTRALAHLIAGDVGGGALEPVAVSRDALDPSTAAQAIADFVRSVLRDRRSAATGRPERWMA